MIVGGIIPMIVGRLVFFPFPGVDPPRTPWGTNLTEPLIPYPDSAALHFAPHYSPPAIGIVGVQLTFIFRTSCNTILSRPSFHPIARVKRNEHGRKLQFRVVFEQTLLVVVQH